jgi:8-oxo-dGTP diphosphatase
MARKLQAGAIAFRYRGKRTEFLLVNRPSFPGEWVFPKGNVKTDDSLEETALKELREEAGADGVVLSRIGRLERGTIKQPVSITYFLVHSGRTVPNGEGRKVRWLTLNEAEEILDDRGARALLRRAADEIG